MMEYTKVRGKIMEENIEALKEKEIRELKIKRTINKIRPYIQRDGGDVEFSRLEDDVVYVKMHGACLGCAILDSTLKDGIEALILDQVEGVREVRLDMGDAYGDIEKLFEESL